MERLSPDLLATLDSLLKQALELEQPEREAWLARLRHEQPAQAAEVAALLANEAGLDAAGFLRTRAGEDALGKGLNGRRLGAYTLERPLGKGGMGTVWLARRSDGRYEGQAAVKLLNLALLDPVGSERFRREGTLLARLNHPNIARLLDAGVTGSGQPYLVLEYVEGTRLDRYCDERRLSPEARLRLFLDVLAAVSHAHANLIVHRDLKPSNILVTQDGTVKLLDFGIAKLLQEGQSEAEAPTLTGVGERVLTPEYAAPEQIRGEAVTIATDVYALGVLLYVLLAGRHPGGDAGRVAAEYLRGTLDTEPPRLSAAVTAPEARASSLERLRRLYAGDLDNILTKALRKRPEDRYATVDALAEDLRRHLNHEPVHARAESWGYRAAKFIRRHRAAVAAATVAILSLVGATAFSLVQLQQARRQRDAAVAESRRRLAMADVQGVLAGDTRGAGGRALSVLERIELAEGMLRRKYRTEPAVVVELLAHLSGRLFDMNDMQGHRRILDSALAIARRADLPAHAALANCLRVLSLAYDDQLDSAAAWLAAAVRDTSQTSRLVTAMWLPPAETQLYLEQGRLADARRAAAALARDTPSRRITAAWLRARLERAEGDSAGARVMLDSAFVAEAAAAKPAPHLVYALLTAAEWRRQDGDLRGADSLASLAIRAAGLDLLALSRSAHVGRAELVRARVAAARGDSAAAMQAARRAAAALGNGFGRGHPLTMEAEGLRDSLK